MEDVLLSFSGSQQELLALSTPVVEQTTYELQMQIQEDKDFFQVSKEHWQELWSIATDEAKGTKERLIAIIRLITIVNFFTFLSFVYFKNVEITKRGGRTPSVLF